MPTFTQALLWLFVIDLGIASGAGLYEQRMIVPQWFSGSPPHVDAEAMRRTDPGRKFWAWVTTVPLTLLTVASLVVAWRLQGPARDWWLAAAVITVGERIGTFGFFIPTALKLMNAEILPDFVAAPLASNWARLNLVRGALSLAGWLASLKALKLLD